MQVKVTQWPVANALLNCRNANYRCHNVSAEYSHCSTAVASLQYYNFNMAVVMEFL